MLWCLCLCALLSLSGGELYRFPAQNNGGTSQLNVTRIVRGTKNATLAVLSNPNGRFHVYFPEIAGKCVGWATTTDLAQKHDCLFATNGGPFDRVVSACDGPLVSDGKIFSSSAGNAFGVTKSGEYVLGAFTESDVKNLGLTQLVRAFDMLVINGTAVKSDAPLIAPRTTIGTNKAGELLIFEVDGVEGTTGCALDEIAKWMVEPELGFFLAINLDGGGSSTVAYPNGKLFDMPHCHDTPEVCERDIQTILCLK